MLVFLAHIKDLFVGFWRCVLSQHLNGNRYLHIFPIRGPNSLKYKITIEKVQIQSKKVCITTDIRPAHTL